MPSTTAIRYQKGLLLINLGTPDRPTNRAARAYLRAFLSDPRVLDLPFVFRWVLLNTCILPFRSRRTSSAYRKIWCDTGSPLRYNTEQLTHKMAQRLPEDYRVAFGMRYGKPSITLGLDQLASCTSITLLPLFPQYASASTGSAIAAALDYFGKQRSIPSLHVINHFYRHPAFIRAYAAHIKAHIAWKPNHLLLLSYHGLPERHLLRSGCQASCDRQQACPSIQKVNARCYRAQCYETSRLLAHALHLSDTQYKVCFQSRLGRIPWIKPYTDETLHTLRQAGVQNLTIACPSFVSDCLETLEEIGITANAYWQRLGGHTFQLIPCLNADDRWVDALLAIVGVQSGHAQTQKCSFDTSKQRP